MKRHASIERLFLLCSETIKLFCTKIMFFCSCQHFFLFYEISTTLWVRIVINKFNKKTKEINQFFLSYLVKSVSISNYFKLKLKLSSKPETNITSASLILIQLLYKSICFKIFSYLYAT